MRITEKFTSALDWLGRGQLLYQLLVAGGLGTAMRAVLSIYAHLNPLWITPIWLTSSGVFLWLLIVVGDRIGTGKPAARGSQSVSGQVTVSSLFGTPASNGPTFDATQFFRHSYYSPLTAEAEKNIQIIAQTSSPNDHEGFFARFIGVGLVAYIYDTIWAYIYKSQLLMLLELNRRGGLMTLGDAKTFYDRAAAECSSIYSHYSYKQWLDFMKVHSLVLEHPSNMLEITVQGKDFLKYLTHWGRYPAERAC